ncbi:Endonuclease/exonuclease/phosphatase [Corchorus capsularis]|uniref:Endonuclease/exonuclease/phosphatase n=1 Tax=Corchorus capsularis TaxID=210143 RepID=A0A1R3FXZ5_COCAP|nr:Endonuclease/exonuclease/phosphatase [Corchorus capsularis]
MAWFYLVGKLFSERRINQEAFRNVLYQIWRLESKFQIKEIGDHLFVFHFEDELEKDRVFVNQPWSFNKALLALNDYDGFEAPERIPFEITPFWVRIYGLPIRMMNEKIAVAVGEAVGPVLEADEECGRFLGLESRRELGKPVKKYSRSLKAESLNVRTGRSPGADGSFQKGAYGGLLTPDNGGRVAPSASGIRGSGSQSLPSRSIANGGASFRNHVDSLALGRGRGALRENRERDVGLVNSLGINGSVRRGDKGVGGKLKQPLQSGNRYLGRAVPNMEESLGESPVVAEVNLVGATQTYPPSNDNVKAGVSGPTVGPVIPGVGPSRLGHTGFDIVSSQMDIRGPAAVSPTARKNTVAHQVSKNTTYSSEESYDPSCPFVFVAGGSGTRKMRKWKKQARVSEHYSFDLLCYEPPFRAGSKRSTGISIQGDGYGGNFKRSREADMEVETHEAVIPVLPRDKEVVQEGGGTNQEGLGAPRAVHALVNLVLCNKPSFIFLSETKRKKNEMDWIRYRLGYDNCFTVECVGRAGDLALLWSNDISIHILSYSNSHIDAAIDNNSLNPWRFTGFYGSPQTNHLRNSWNLLRLLHSQFSLPWLCAGDFNEIISNEEKHGGAWRLEHQMRLFRDIIEDCELNDLPVLGPLKTWSRRINGEMVYERLDRALVSRTWLNQFGESVEKHCVSPASDHLPLIITISSCPSPVFTKRKAFRYLSMWLSNEGFKETVSNSWRGDRSRNLLQKIEGCSKALADWNREVFGCVRFKIESRRKD